MTARVACIGTGFMAGKHLAALAAFDDVDVVAVADPVVDRARAVADDLGARAYEDGLELLATEELDAVWMCVPPFAHGALERAAIARDLPFFVEKPLAHDLETATTIAEELSDRGLLAAVGYHWRYLDVVERVAEHCRELPPHLVTGYWLDSTPPVAWWSQRSSSGGQVIEQTTHLFDLARLLVGEVERVWADELVVAGTDPGPDAPVPLVATAQLRFRSGCLGAVSSARTLPARHRVGLHLVGDGYAVELAESAIVDHELRITDGSGTTVERSDQDPVAAEDRAFLDAVLGRGDDVRAPYAEAIRSHALAWAADVSAREGRPVDVTPVGVHA